MRTWRQIFPFNLVFSSDAPAPSSTSAATCPLLPDQVPVIVINNTNGCCCSCRCDPRKKPPGAPKGKVTVRTIEEIGTMSLKFEIDLNTAPPVAPDVARRHLFLTIGDAGQQEIIKDLGDNLAEFVCERGDPVACYIRDEDADGNLGDPGELNSFIAQDTIPPGAPGKVGVTLVDDNYTEPTTTPAP